MILAAGLSPAWQQILQIETLRHGQVNRAKAATWCASGKVLNVALAAHNLGERTTVLSSLGGLTGNAIAAEFEGRGITSEWIQVAEATRVCTTILEADGTSTELVEETAPVSYEVFDEFVDCFRIFSQVAAVSVLTGSLPSNAPDDYYARLIRNTPARFILDIRGEGLLQCLPYCPFLVKPNREELSTTFGTSLDDEASLIKAMLKLNAMGARWVVISDGPDALYATGDEQVLKVTPPRVETINPIGCGDCLAAGIAVAVSKQFPMIDALKYGVASAALNASRLLPAQIEWEETSVLANSIVIESLD